MEVQKVLEEVALAKEKGASRFCMGGEQKDRVGLLHQLSQMSPHPDSVPINMLVNVKGTPLENVEDLDAFEFIRTIAVARIIIPKSHVGLSAGRHGMNEQTQALRFMAGANSIFYGEKNTDNR